MGISTSGYDSRFGSRLVRELVELLSSMRFSIALLVIICIASVIGTVILQNEPFANHVNQFGPFWAEVFAAVGLFSVYGAWWYMLMLAFLVVSTSLCIVRNTPKIVAELKSYKEDIREQSLLAFRHKARGTLAERRDAVFERSAALLSAAGWKAKVQTRPDGMMIAARKGASNRLGYLATHGAIVLIFVGGLLDSSFPIRVQMLVQGKEPFFGSGLISEVPAQHRLSPLNPSFRGNLLVPEGGVQGTAILLMDDGVVLQDLPFVVQLTRFTRNFHEATGTSSLYRSEIVIHDRDTGATRQAVVEVNHPVYHRGVMLYQASFDDGGSSLQMRVQPLEAGARSFDLEGTVGAYTTIERPGEEAMRIEFSGLRVVNVSNFAPTNAADVADYGGGGLWRSLQGHLGSGAHLAVATDMRNVGPSVTYLIRDAAGQAIEFHNYMLPIELDGHRVFLAGVRRDPNEDFRYLRIPADAQDSMETWLQMRRALDDPALRERAAHRYAVAASPPDRPEMTAQLRVSALRLLTLFAGQDPADQPLALGNGNHGIPPVQGGLASLARFLELTVPPEDRERVSELLLRILSGSLFELLNASREAAGQPVLQPDVDQQAFMSRAVMSLSDSFFYPAPLLLQMTDFTQVQASVFQVSRAPGKGIVYLGSALLTLGIILMFYVRERRLWIWIEDDPEAVAPGERTRVTAALSTTRRTLDLDEEFDQLRRQLLPVTPAPVKETA
jgi:cytochrome c biogenesis protein